MPWLLARFNRYYKHYDLEHSPIAYIMKNELNHVQFYIETCLRRIQSLIEKYSTQQTQVEVYKRKYL